MLDIGLIFGHICPVVALPLHAPVEAYVVVSTNRARNMLEFCSGLIFRYGWGQDASTASIVEFSFNGCEAPKFFCGR